MMARVVSSNPDMEAQDWLAGTDDDILACRGQGHNWPKIKPTRGGRKLPRGISTERYAQGVVELTFTCRDCGMKRRLVTAPRGELDLPASYTYVQPVGYKAPKGSGVTRRQCFEEVWRRAREQVLESAQEQEEPTTVIPFSG